MEKFRDGPEMIKLIVRHHMIGNILLFIFLLLPPTYLIANDEAFPELQVDLYGGSYSKEEIKKELINAKVVEHQIGMLSKDERNAIFESIKGLSKYLLTFDELAKDQLVIRAEVKKTAVLETFYPQIPANFLKAIKEKVENLRRTQ